jgi:phosphopantothenoylcysteine synthetase/decarboxylase
MKKKVVISCGPIPARLDSVKFLTNRFKGGLAFKTANFLKDEYDLTIVKWTHTELPNKYDWTNTQIVNVIDVAQYYKWFEEHAADYDAFIMAAAVANLMPSNPWEGKFPSHNYKVGDQFDIKFEIAPRAIDIIKKVNPRACLI